MKVRKLVAGLFLVLELPVLLPFAAGAAIFGAVAVLCSKESQVAVCLFLRDCGYRLRVTFYEQGRKFPPVYLAKKSVALDRMPDIGSTLREARMRERIDIGEVEAQTKIHAKYLRAIENEEWDLLPGPVYAKSFLRTYGGYLGLDSRIMVDEFRRRYERPSQHEIRRVSRAQVAVRFLRDWGYRLRVIRVRFHQKRQEVVIVALGLAAAVALGALIAGSR